MVGRKVRKEDIREGGRERGQNKGWDGLLLLKEKPIEKIG